MSCVHWSTLAHTTHPSGSAACRRAGLKHFGWLVSDLGVRHDRRGVERVRIGIGGHALLKDRTHDRTRKARKRNRTNGAGDGGGELTKFLCISSILFLTFAIMLSNTLKGFLVTSCAAGKKEEQRRRSCYRDHMLLSRYHQLVNEHITHGNRGSQGYGGLKVASVCEVRRWRSRFITSLKIFKSHLVVPFVEAPGWNSFHK